MKLLLIVLFILAIILFIRKIIIEKIGKTKYQIIILNLFTIFLIIFFICNPEIPLSLFEEELPVIIGILFIGIGLIFFDVFGIVLWVKGKIED